MSIHASSEGSGESVHLSSLHDNKSYDVLAYLMSPSNAFRPSVDYRACVCAVFLLSFQNILCAYLKEFSHSHNVCL